METDNKVKYVICQMVVSAEGRAEAEVVILGGEELAEKVLFE